jgi:transcriptional antiterminator Rof (Rho-off)
MGGWRINNADHGYVCVACEEHYRLTLKVPLASSITRGARDEV